MKPNTIRYLIQEGFVNVTYNEISKDRYEIALQVLPQYNDLYNALDKDDIKMISNDRDFIIAYSTNLKPI